MSGDVDRRKHCEDEVARTRAELDRARKAKAEASRQGEDATEWKAAIERAEVAFEEAKRVLAIVEKTGSDLGVVVRGDEVVGTIAVAIGPGTDREGRFKAIDDALAGDLDACARELGGVLDAAPHRYVRERPGRDASGRTVFDVVGALEGDKVVPRARSSKRK